MRYSTTFRTSFFRALFVGSTYATTSAWINKTLNVGYVIFPGYEPLDVYGPIEILYELSAIYNMTLSTIGPTLGPQSARAPMRDWMLGPATVATHTFENAPPLDVIIVPGGGGLDTYELENNRQIEDFLASRYESTAYVMSVCTGAVTLAKSGILKGKRATTNKAAFIYVADPKHGSDIHWVPSARWVVDGKIWTSSGVAAGMDMMYAFMKHIYGEEEWVDWVMNLIEYAPHTNPQWDPFSVVWNASLPSKSIRGWIVVDRRQVPGANKSQSLADCAAPVGSGNATTASFKDSQDARHTVSWAGVGGLS